MERRTFLGTLLASIGALTIDPSSLLWTPPDGVLGLPPLDGDALVNLQQITAIVAYELEKLWKPKELIDEYRIGAGGLTSLAHSNSLYLPDAVDVSGYDPKNCKRIAEGLAAYLDSREATRCGVLPTKVPGAYVSTVVRRMLSVRGVVQYDIQQDAHAMRFTVVSG